MKNLTLDAIARACEGRLVGGDKGGAEAACVVIDSRKLTEGGVFIATKGERVDGHDFIPDVVKKGALGVVCEKEPEDCKAPYILVSDSFAALRKIAEYYREQLAIPVVGITGSVGKTSTKEMIASVLSVKYRVCKTEGNFNNEIGLPLTILSIRDTDEAAVVEMGISDFGEMTRLTQIAKPDTCVITNIGQCHLERLGDRDGVLRAKTEIFKGLSKDGAVVLNGDDDKLRTVQSPNGRAVRFYGNGAENELSVKNKKSHGLFGSEADFVYRSTDGERVFHVTIPLPGAHAVMNALAAALVGFEYGLTPEEIAQGIAKVTPTGGRSNLIRTDRFAILDDCYNANPVSVKAALSLLSEADTRRVALLGDMFELGSEEEALHYGVGAYAAEGRADVLIGVGALSKHTCAGAREHTLAEVYHFDTVSEIREALSQLLRDGDTVLVKASHGMHFEQLVEALKGL